jgi:hypothetical protein
MKNNVILLCIFLCLTIVSVNGQVADGITYQAVALDENGKEIAGQDINGNIINSKRIDVRFSIVGGTLDGEVLYTEVHSASTDQFGLFSLVIGHGIVSSDGKYQKLTDMNWGAEELFLKVEIDINRSGNFKVMGIQQMMSVPFAFYALTTPKATVDFADLMNKPMFSNVATSGDYSDLINKPHFFNGDYNDLINKPDLFDGDYNDLINKPDLFKGDYNDLINKPKLFDGDYNDLINKPELFDGDYNDLINKPDLFDGDYNDLDNKPDLFDGDFNSLVNKPAITRETTDEFLAATGQTTFTLRNVPSETMNLKMFINGIRISNSACRNSGVTLTYIPANNGSYTLMAGDRIQIDYSY